MLDKYVEERYSRYFTFGTFPDGDVDLASIRRDEGCKVTPETADLLIKERDKVIDVLCRMADAFDNAAPEAFSEFWYNSEISE